MTVSTTLNKAIFNGSGSTGPFTFNFNFYDNDDIDVIKTSTLGVDTTLTEVTHYTLTGAGGDTGGSVTLATALNTGEKLTIMRVLDLVQGTALPNNGPFYAEVIETAMDYQTMLVQQIDETLDRAIRFSPASGYAGELTLPSSTRVNKVLGFDGNGDITFLDTDYNVTVSEGLTAVIRADATNAPITVDLPDSGDVTIIKIDSSANTVTISPEGTVLEIPGESAHLIFDNGAWITVD